MLEFSSFIYGILGHHCKEVSIDVALFMPA